MFRKIVIILTVFVALATNTVFSQKNSIRLQTGLFHVFFDKTPLLNINYTSKNFNGGPLLSSVGLTYKRNLKYSFAIEFEAQYYQERYSKNTNKFPITKPIVGWREYSTFLLGVSKSIVLNEKIKFNFGIGFNYRSGNEAVIVNRFPIYVSNGYTIYELSIENVIKNDLGLNTFCGIEYIPKKWLTLYSKIDLLGVFYFNNKSTIKRLEDVYKVKNYPTRFDLSLKFGVGFNF